MGYESVTSLHNLQYLIFNLTGTGSNDYRKILYDVYSKTTTAVYLILALAITVEVAMSARVDDFDLTLLRVGIALVAGAIALKGMAVFRNRKYISTVHKILNYALENSALSKFEWAPAVVSGKDRKLLWFISLLYVLGFITVCIFYFTFILYNMPPFPFPFFHLCPESVRHVIYGMQIITVFHIYLNYFPLDMLFCSFVVRIGTLQHILCLNWKHFTCTFPQINFRKYVTDYVDYPDADDEIKRFIHESDFQSNGSYDQRFMYNCDIMENTRLFIKENCTYYQMIPT